MSHFTVTVIGDNIEAQLEKYDEGIVFDEYVKRAVTDKEKEDFVSYYLRNAETPQIEGNEKMTKEELFETLYEKHGKDWNDNCYRKNADGVWEYWSTYNPDSKWDWYQIGGRWAGFFKTKFSSPLLDELGFSLNEVLTLANLKDKNLKKFNDAIGKYNGKSDQIKTIVSLYNATKGEKSNRVDQAKKGDIDFEGMRIEKRESALNRFDRLAKLFGGTIPTMTLSFDQAIEQTKENNKEDYDKARELYWAQPALKALQDLRNKDHKNEDDRSLLIWLDLNDYQCTRKQYGERAYNSAVSTYAIVKDGVWYQKGEMGWWGMSSDEMTQDQWNDEVNKLLDSTPDNVMITLVDCHI